MENIQIIIGFIGSVIAFIYMQKLRKNLQKGEVSNATLTRKERIYVSILVILAPLIAGALFYYGWIKRYPKKAKSANKYSIIVFLIMIGISLLVEGV